MSDKWTRFNNWVDFEKAADTTLIESDVLQVCKPKAEIQQTS